MNTPEEIAARREELLRGLEYERGVSKLLKAQVNALRREVKRQRAFREWVRKWHFDNAGMENPNDIAWEDLRRELEKEIV